MMNSTLYENARHLQEQLALVFPISLPLSFSEPSKAGNMLFDMETPWNQVTPKDGDSRLAEEFDLLNDAEQLYYFPAYLSAALTDEYHEVHLMDIILSTSILSRLTGVQLEWLGRYIRWLQRAIMSIYNPKEWWWEKNTTILRGCAKVEKRLDALLGRRRP